MKLLKWVLLAPLIALLLLFVLGTFVQPSPQDEAAARKACADAIMSSYGTSVTSYADRKAYNDHVRAKCKGFDVKPPGP